jgi:hypothetical protein
VRPSPSRPALALSLLLCQEIDVGRVGWGRLEEVPDAAGEVALEAADGLGAGLALGALAGDVGLRFGVAAQPRDRDAVDGGIDMAVATAVEPMAVGVARADWDRCDAAGASELGVGGKALRAGDLADELAGGSGPKPGSASSCGAA